MGPSPVFIPVVVVVFLIFFNFFEFYVVPLILFPEKSFFFHTKILVFVRCFHLTLKVKYRMVLTKLLYQKYGNTDGLLPDLGFCDGISGVTKKKGWFFGL